jgi:hypothetical protein
MKLAGLLMNGASGRWWLHLFIFLIWTEIDAMEDEQENVVLVFKRKGFGY